MLSVCRLSLLAALAAPLALGAVPCSAQETVTRRVPCGAYDAVPSGFRSSGEPTRLTIQKAGRLLVTLTDWAITSARCEDLTADGVQELLVRTYSGGAHCCETLRVYALGRSPRLVLEYAANNATGVKVEDLDGDGRKELVLGDDTFAYFDDLCYACSPVHLPLVACFADDRVEDCTRRFPDLLRAELKRYLSRLKPPTSAETLMDAEGSALGAVAVSLLLGEEEQGLEAVREAAPSAELQAWLAKALPQVRDWVAARAKKLKDGRGNR